MRIIVLRIALLLAGLLALLPGMASAQLSDPEAVEVMSAVYTRAIKVNAFQSEFHLIRQDPEFLGAFFPEDRFRNTLSVQGIVNYDSPSRQYNLYFRVEGVDYQHFSAEGNSVDFRGRERIYNLLKDPRPVRIEAEPQPSPSPSPEASPEASPAPSPSPEAEPAKLPELSPEDPRPVAYHPLLFMWPWVLHQPDVRAKYDLLSRKELVFGHQCFLIQVRGGANPNPTLLWVDPRTEQVIQIEAVEPTSGRKVRATYTSFNPLDSQTGFSLYNRVQVEVDGKPAYLAELTMPQLNPNQIVSTASSEEPTRRASARGPRNEDLGPAVQFLTGGLIFLVSLLSLVLAVLGYRYYRFAVSRQEFSDELVLIDEEDGRFSEMLGRLGYPTVPFNPEVMTQERLLLGKGATADTTRRPRGVIVAPESFAEIKSYFFLLRAYVEDGGRVLVMYHSPKAAATMPFSASFLPLSPSDPATEFHCRPGLFNPETTAEVERLAGSLAAKELYKTADDRSPAVEFLVARNKNTGVKGVALGVLRQGKGEYLLCQLHFDPRLTTTSAPVRRVLGDLIRHLQARKPEREEG